MKTATNDLAFQSALAEGARLVAARRAEFSVKAPPSSASAIDDEDAWLDDFIDLAPQAAPSGGRGSGPSAAAPGPMAAEVESLLKAIGGSASFVAENACPCGKAKKPVKATVCRRCERAALRAAYLLVGETSVPERFRGAAVNAQGVCLDGQGKPVAAASVVGHVRAMCTASGLIRGQSTRAAMVIAALFAEVVAAAKAVEVEGDTAWKGHALVRRAARLRWLPAFAFEAEKGKGEESIVDAACRGSVLVIEDLVPETLPHGAATALGHTVRRRLHEGKATIVTTGATPGELARRLGASFEEALSAVTPVMDLAAVVVGQNTLNGHSAASMRLLRPR